ncbi:hypothetical protein DUNSADRAFT_2546 [Dunaliella salina]|uniref:Uncharacterized protein n=1 Tax=Dunaliella salina TaxID=3046 RepID=A0ABQ7FW58_DUNSA|nr:hypothetical protein DUNSADRAFT_2546 [Dunaliella salina]|eukprot:KAF5826608.1 hypothetical protein DUNSADRAFT_2546 [Dunaliella salina]
MLVKGPTTQGPPIPPQGLTKQEGIASAPAAGGKQRVQPGSSRALRFAPAKAPSLTKERKQLQRKWFSKHAERIGLQKRENERLIQKLQDKINGAAARGETLPHQLGASYSSMALLDPLDAPQTAGAAPMVVLERKLHAARRQQRELDAQDLTRIDVVVSKLMQLSAQLDADVTLVARIAAEEGSILLQPPAEVQMRLRMLQQRCECSCACCSECVPQMMCMTRVQVQLCMLQQVCVVSMRVCQYAVGMHACQCA